MKKVVLIRSNPVQPYPRLEKTANALLKAGHQIHVLAWDRECDYEPKEEILSLANGNVPITRIGIKGEFSGGFKKNFKSLLLFQWFIYRWLNKNKKEYDVIHPYDFDTGFISLLCAKKNKKKLIYDIPDYYVDSHGLKGSAIGKIVQNLENRVINKADAVIICTEKRKEQIKGTVPKKLVVLHNTPYDQQLDVNTTSNYQFGKDRLKLVYVGVFGSTRFIDRIAETVAKRNDCEFHIGGYGGNMEKYFEDWSKKCDRIKYYGRVPYGQTLSIEKNCDVICAIYDPSVPNHYYAAPNKFYEALMLGKPIIMSKDTGMDDIVSSEDIGVVIDYSVKGLEEAIDELLERKQDWTNMGKRARKLYECSYSWSVMEQKLLNLYDEM